MWTSLEPPATSVAPGDSTVVRLRVRNTGDTVEEYRLSPAGEAAGWARVEPDVLRIYPGAEGTAEVTFAPPRTSDAVAGPVPFGIRVEPREHPEAGDVAEGRLTIGPFTELRAELVPRTLRGRRSARGRVAIDNLGNQPLTASFSTRDNGDAFGVDVNPGAVQVAPGRAGFAELQLTAAKISWFGPRVSANTSSIPCRCRGPGRPRPGRSCAAPTYSRRCSPAGSWRSVRSWWRRAVAFALIWFKQARGSRARPPRRRPPRRSRCRRARQHAAAGRPRRRPRRGPGACRAAPRPRPPPTTEAEEARWRRQRRRRRWDSAPKPPKYDPGKLVRIQSGLGIRT